MAFCHIWNHNNLIVDDFYALVIEHEHEHEHEHERDHLDGILYSRRIKDLQYFGY